jgi:hypothetical protein
MSTETSHDENTQDPQEGAPIPSGHEADTGDGEEVAESGNPDDDDALPGED